MDEVYNGGFAPEFSVSMLKETIALVRDFAFYFLVSDGGNTTFQNIIIIINFGNNSNNKNKQL